MLTEKGLIGCLVLATTLVVGLALGTAVSHYTSQMLSETFWIWVEAGALFGMIVSFLISMGWLEDDPGGVLKFTAISTAAGAIVLPAILWIGWVEWWCIQHIIHFYTG
jgi:hypothetical protein